MRCSVVWRVCAAGCENFAIYAELPLLILFPVAFAFHRSPVAEFASGVVFLAIAKQVHFVVAAKMHRRVVKLAPALRIQIVAAANNKRGRVKNLAPAQGKLGGAAVVRLGGNAARLA
ncbi:hypothetical protein R83H12_02857 [Fibrobacteria bacterium R8-3-H12]